MQMTAAKCIVISLKRSICLTPSLSLAHSLSLTPVYTVRHSVFGNNEDPFTGKREWHERILKGEEVEGVARDRGGDKARFVLT